MMEAIVTVPEMIHAQTFLELPNLDLKVMIHDFCLSPGG